MKPAPLRRSADAPPETLGHRAYERLCDMITAGALTPGATLSLREVAGALDISMTPVREAVSRLAAAGALVIKPGRAAAVPQMDLAAFVISPKQGGRLRATPPPSPPGAEARRSLPRLNGRRRSFAALMGITPPNSPARRGSIMSFTSRSTAPPAHAPFLISSGGCGSRSARC